MYLSLSNFHCQEQIETFLQLLQNLTRWTNFLIHQHFFLSTFGHCYSHLCLPRLSCYHHEAPILYQSLILKEEIEDLIFDQYSISFLLFLFVRALDRVHWWVEWIRISSDRGSLWQPQHPQDQLQPKGGSKLILGLVQLPQGHQQPPERTPVLKPSSNSTV